jgi:hypothetical protein
VSAAAPTIEGTVAALYEAVGFAPGGEPDWARLATLFAPDARLIPPQVGEPPELRVLDFAGWRDESRAFLAGEGRGLRERGFREVELWGRVERIGALAHAWSAYASRYDGEREPFARGINSIQLVRRDGLWLVLGIAWEAERPGVEVPPASR